MKLLQMVRNNSTGRGGLGMNQIFTNNAFNQPFDFVISKLGKFRFGHVPPMRFLMALQQLVDKYALG
jgi:hypothetical protein